MPNALDPGKISLPHALDPGKISLPNNLDPGKISLPNNLDPGKIRSRKNPKYLESVLAAGEQRVRTPISQPVSQISIDGAQ